MMPKSILGLLLFVALVAVGCATQDPAERPDEASAVQAASDAVTAYEVRGRIVEVQDDGRTLLVDHEEIPGYMAAMTMPFSAKDVAESQGLAAGDAITFRYLISDDGMWIEDIERLGEGSISASPSAEAEPEYGEPTAESLYWLDDEWTTQDGSNIRLASLEGQPVVMGMIFTHCGYACPMIVRDMKRIGSQLPENGSVQYVLISLDPDRDTPEQMSKFARSHRLDPDQWTLLRGSKSQVRMLAAALGIRYRKESDGQFAHSNLLSILDHSGEVVHQQKGLQSDGAESAQVIEGLLAAR